MEPIQLISPIHENKIWLKILGVVSIIYGAFLVLSVAGIIFAWIPIWVGVVLYQIASKAEAAMASQDAADALAMMEKIGLYFKILGIFTLVAVVLTVLGLIFFGTMIGDFMAELM